MVRLDKHRVPAPGNATSPAVPTKHGATSCRRDGLGCSDGLCIHVVANIAVAADAHVCVNVSDVLPVALRHLDDFWTDFDGLAATLLRRAAAALTNRERDLVARAARGLDCLRAPDGRGAGWPPPRRWTLPRPGGFEPSLR